MILVGALAAFIWGASALAGVPVRARWGLVTVLLLAVVLGQVALPDGHPLREATGGEPAPWVFLLGFGALVAVYLRGLRWLRVRATPAPAVTQGTFSEAELGRYARHMILREIGGPGQKRLKQARVLVVGAGGLGSPALQYLAAAGVGTIGVVDDDTVEATNLQRQVIHTDAMIGQPKVASAQAAMLAQNPFVTVLPYRRRMDAALAEALLPDYDIVLDGTDNFETRYVVNAACARAGKPLVGAALTQWEGQISVWDPARGAPCYACVFAEAPDRSLVPSCAEAGVLSPLPGIVGAMMAAEAVKLITGAGEPLRGRMMIYDALYAEARVIALERQADCPVCGGLHA